MSRRAQMFHKCKHYLLCVSSWMKVSKYISRFMVYLYACIYEHLFVNICVYASMHACMCTCMLCARKHVCLHACMHAIQRMQAPTFVCMYTCDKVWTCVWICIHTHTCRWHGVSYEGRQGLPSKDRNMWMYVYTHTHMQITWGAIRGDTRLNMKDTKCADVCVYRHKNVNYMGCRQRG